MRGQVLVEVVIVLMGIALPLIFFHLELARASQFQIFLRHSCFQYVRAKALGASDAQAMKKIRNVGDSFFPNSNFEKWSRYVDIEVWAENNFLYARLKRRYQSLLPFLQNRFQMTKVCKFSL